MNRTPILAAALAALPLAALAQTPAAPADVLTVTGAYARSTNPKAGAAFMTIENKGSADCVLKGASAPAVTDRAELHTNREENGVMSMLSLESITVPAGGSHALERGGDHIMLMDTKAPLAEGDRIALTLDFGDCGQVPLTVAVDNKAGMPGAPGQAQGAGHMGGHDAPAAQGHGTGHGAPAN